MSSPPDSSVEEEEEEQDEGEEELAGELRLLPGLTSAFLALLLVLGPFRMTWRPVSMSFIISWVTSTVS